MTDPKLVEAVLFLGGAIFMGILLLAYVQRQRLERMDFEKRTYGRVLTRSERRKLIRDIGL